MKVIPLQIKTGRWGGVGTLMRAPQIMFFFFSKPCCHECILQYELPLQVKHYFLPILAMKSYIPSSLFRLLSSLYYLLTFDVNRMRRVCKKRIESTKDNRKTGVEVVG